VSVGGLLALDQVLEHLVIFDRFWDFDTLLKMERQDEAEITGSQSTFGPFLGFWVNVMGKGCRPVGLPTFRPIL
jgi:hypothetical protein